MSISSKAAVAVGGFILTAVGFRRERSPDPSPGLRGHDPDRCGDHFECPRCDSGPFCDVESWSDHMEERHDTEGPL